MARLPFFAFALQYFQNIFKRNRQDRCRKYRRRPATDVCESALRLLSGNEGDNAATYCNVIPA
jgi:hypothetical protein